MAAKFGWLRGAFGVGVAQPPATDGLHGVRVAGGDLVVAQEGGKHCPWVLAAAVLQDFLFEHLAGLARERRMRKHLAPHARGDRAVEEVAVVRRAVAEQVAELSLPRGVLDGGEEAHGRLDALELGGGAERGVARALRVVLLVELREDDLVLRVERVELVLRAQVRRELVVRERRPGAVVVRGELHHLRVHEEVLHEDGRELDKVGGAACAGHVVELGATDHRCVSVGRTYSGSHGPFRGRASRPPASAGG